MTTNTTPQFVPDARPVPPVRFLSPDGVLADGAEPAMDDATVIESLRYMVYGRAFDVKSFSLQRQGKLGTFAPLVGQEASIMGPAFATDLAARAPGYGMPGVSADGNDLLAVHKVDIARVSRRGRLFQ